jgi:hypothetical protein
MPQVPSVTAKANMQSPVLDQQLQVKITSQFDRRLPVSSTGGCQSVRPAAASQFDWRLGGSQSV